MGVAAGLGYLANGWLVPRLSAPSTSPLACFDRAIDGRDRAMVRSRTGDHRDIAGSGRGLAITATSLAPVAASLDAIAMMECKRGQQGSRPLPGIEPCTSKKTTILYSIKLCSCLDWRSINTSSYRRQ
eukprot:356469-Chlamydomonas_euryale.AAC.4